MTPVTEEAFGLFIDERNAALQVSHDHRARRGFDHQAKARLGGGGGFQQTRIVECHRRHVSQILEQSLFLVSELMR